MSYLSISLEHCSILFDIYLIHLFRKYNTGCDGSLLLDDTSNFIGEKTTNPNNGSVWGFEVIDQIKSAVKRTL